MRQNAHRSFPLKINPDALRTIRERSGLTVPQLAKTVDPPCSHATLYDIEARNKGASPAFILRLARALKCPVTAIVEDVTDDELRRLVDDLEPEAA